MHLDLSELSQLAPIFRELFKGFHVSRRDPELYAQLSNFQDQYRTLFKALGFELVCDTRGFYYFVPDNAAAQVNKTATTSSSSKPARDWVKPRPMPMNAKVARKTTQPT